MSLYYPAGKAKYGNYYLYATSIILVLTCLIALLKLGILGVLALCALIIMVAILPLLLNRYKFYLFIWLFISPAFDNFRALLIAGANPVVLIMTAITMPFALILIIRSFKQVVFDIPFVACLALFNLVLILNLFRPNAEDGILLECLKIFIEMFVIFCGYQEIKAGHSKAIFNGINIFMIVNSLIAIFQRITGIGMIMVEGLPRVGGLVGHPNCLAFVNVLYLPFATYKIINSTAPKEKRIWLAGVVICTIALLLTLCKNVIIVLLLQTGILFLFLPFSQKVRVFSGLAIALVLLFAAEYIFQLHFIDQLSNRVNNNSSFAWRLKIWGYLLSSVDNSNLLAGHGVNAAKSLIAMIDSRGSSFAHNAYLQLLYDYGLTGLTFLMAFIYPFIEFFTLFLRAPRQERLNRVIPLLILLAILMNMASDNSVFLRTPMVFAWLFLIYLYLRTKKPQEIAMSSGG